MQQLLLINPENVTLDEVASYRVRSAARAIVIDADGNVALLHVGKYGSYKLPGGGIDEGEDIVEALARECMEEIGCKVQVCDEVGIIEEYYKALELKQTSYCYVARVIGSKGQSNFTGQELANEFSIVWAPKDEAQNLLDNCVSTSNQGRDYIVPRDRCFLVSALEVLSKAVEG